MKNHLLILFVLAVTLSACKKDEDPVKVDLLNSPLAVTPYGLSGTINNTYFHITDSLYVSSQTLANDTNDFSTYFLSGVILHSIPSSFSIQLYYLKSTTLDISDDTLFNYMTLGQYYIYDSNATVDPSQTTNSITISSNFSSQNGYYYSKYGPNPPGENYFEITDTLHTRYNNKTAVKFRAKIKCNLYKLPTTDSINVNDAVIVGLFVKP